MTDPSAFEEIHWSLDRANPVVKPGQINGDLDAQAAGAAHVVQCGDR